MLEDIIKRISDLNLEIEDKINKDGLHINIENSSDSVRTQSTETTTGSVNEWKNIYDYNLDKYNNRKQTVYAALLQAKRNTDLYNYNLSSLINNLAGVVILTFLIYKLYKFPTPISSRNKTMADTKTDAKPAKPDTKPAKPDTKPASAKPTKSVKSAKPPVEKPASTK